MAWLVSQTRCCSPPKRAATDWMLTGRGARGGLGRLRWPSAFGPSVRHTELPRQNRWYRQESLRRSPLDLLWDASCSPVDTRSRRSKAAHDIRHLPKSLLPLFEGSRSCASMVMPVQLSPARTKTSPCYVQHDRAMLSLVLRIDRGQRRNTNRLKGSSRYLLCQAYTSCRGRTCYEGRVVCCRG